jgi:hypothetical protein
MLVRTDKIPDFLVSPYPLNDRPRTDGIFGVTEILYCLRKSYLTRKVPAPSAVSNATRKVFARGRALEEVFFGKDYQNPIHFKGGIVDGRDFTKVEGHTDHSCPDENGVPTIIEFKTTKHMWLAHPDGRKYFNITQARKYVSKDDLKLLELQPMQSHLDQLMLYMMLTDAKRGVLIYHEMDSDENYVWEIVDTDITDEFKDRMKVRLDELDAAFKVGVVPQKCPGYEFECRLCHFKKDGLCDLCDQEGFSIEDFISDFEKRGDPNCFMTVVGEYLDKFGLDRSIISSYEVENGNGSK